MTKIDELIKEIESCTRSVSFQALVFYGNPWLRLKQEIQALQEQVKLKDLPNNIEKFIQDIRDSKYTGDKDKVIKDILELIACGYCLCDRSYIDDEENDIEVHLKDRDVEWNLHYKEHNVTLYIYDCSHIELYNIKNPIKWLKYIAEYKDE